MRNPPHKPRSKPTLPHLLTAWLLTLAAFGAQAAPCSDDPPDAPIPDITFEEVAGGFDKPTHVTHAGDGSGRLFVVEQRGMIWIIDNGQRRPQPFLDIRERVRESDAELGLFSVAFHPRYRDNGVLFVNYTSPIGGRHSRIARLRADGDRTDRDRVDPASEQILLRIDQPYSNHNGGQLAFGPDGYLYIGMGDGGAANDPRHNAQNPASLLGKLLRLDVDRAEAPRPYAIPPDNPFRGREKYRPEIWATGLRNPWRFSFDALNGRLYLADVGQNAAEEIDVIRKGGNYGWHLMEGDVCTPSIDSHCNKSGLELPIHVYRHPDGFSITGGFVYRGNSSPALCGVYLYADYVSRRVWGLRYDGSKVTANRELIGPALADKALGRFGASNTPAISSFGVDARNELYAADHRGGRILRVVVPR